MLHRVQHYNIIEELGKGGLGVVYKAAGTWLKGIIALNLLSRNSSHNPKAWERFLREACLASSVQHEIFCTDSEIGKNSDRARPEML